MLILYLGLKGLKRLTLITFQVAANVAVVWYVKVIQGRYEQFEKLAWHLNFNCVFLSCSALIIM